MDFANEYYVRLYTRDTTTWKRLAFEGQTVLMHVLRKMDMAGVLDVEDMEPWEGAVLHCGIPEDFARRGMERCIALGVLIHQSPFLVAPKYREANEASKSDRQRQAESRTRRRARALGHSVTNRSESSHAVTPRHASHDRNGTDASHRVTEGHTRSHAVTLTNSSSNSDAEAAVERSVTPSQNGNGAHGSRSEPAAAAAVVDPIALVSSEEVAREWHSFANQHSPGSYLHAHATRVWREQYEIVAAALNAVRGKPKLALRGVLAWFWTAPDGPIASGRIKNPTPAHLATHISRDLVAAIEWWQADRERVARETQAREVAQ